MLYNCQRQICSEGKNMKLPSELLEDLENLHNLQKEGGITGQEFQSSRKEIIDCLSKNSTLTSRHLKAAHDLLNKKIITQAQYGQLKKNILQSENFSATADKATKHTSKAIRPKTIFFAITTGFVWVITNCIKVFTWIIELIFVNLFINTVLKRKK